MNSLRYSGIGGALASELALKASASLCEIVDEALTFTSEGRVVARRRSPSSMRGVSELSPSGSESWSILGEGPIVQVSFLLISAFLAERSCWTSSRQPSQHQGGHLDILTSPVAQSISGLCFRNQVCPRIIFCFPRFETAKRVLSEWFL